MAERGKAQETAGFLVQARCRRWRWWREKCAQTARMIKNAPVFTPARSRCRVAGSDAAL